MNAMSDDEPDAIPAVTVNVQTGIRWAALREGARSSAIRGQLKGGGASNPHAMTYSLAKKFLVGKLTAKQALKAAGRAKGSAKRHEVRSNLKNLIRLTPHPSGTAGELPPTRIRRSPEGLLELRVAAQLYIEDFEDRYIGFWSNEVELDHRNARLYAQMMRESVSTSDEKRTIFVIYDLKRAVNFIFSVDALDNDAADFGNFFKTMETEIKKARLH